MASITNSAKYGEGHKVVFRTSSNSITARQLSEIRRLNYRPGVDEFKITKMAKFDPDFVIEAGRGNETLNLIDKRNKKLQMIGSESGINNMFNHAGGSAKANTNLQTEIKETFSLVLFRAHTENNKLLNEDEAIKEVERIIPRLSELYESVYYTSAVKQLVEYKKYATGRNYEYERQGDNKTKKLYEVARKLTKKLNDNWNPADVWAIRKGFDMTPLYDAKEAAELNLRLVEAFNKRDVLPISLKQVVKDRATSSLIDPAKLLNQKIDLDFSLNKVDLSESFKNFVLQTNSGFAVRAGFKASAVTLSVALEGRFVSAGYQLGAVDAKIYKEYVKENYNYDIRNGTNVRSTDHELAKKELKEIYQKTNKPLSSKIRDYEHAMELYEASDKLTQQRFCNLISFLYSYTVLPKDFEKHMQFSYLCAKKITSDSSMYVIIEQ